jgi:hypothetical protein
MSEFKAAEGQETPASAPAPAASSGGWWNSISSMASDLERSIMESAKTAQGQMDAEADKIRLGKYIYIYIYIYVCMYVCMYVICVYI